MAARRLMVAAATVSVFGASTAQDASNAAGTVAMTDPLFTGCTVTLLGCYTEGADDPHGRKVKDPAGADIPLKLRSLPYGTACDVCDAGLNQCDAPPNAAGGNWPKAPSAAPACDQAKMTLEYCAKVCMEWFGRSTPGDPMVHDVVYAGAQYGEQCWCMPTMFPATGVDVKKAENTATQCDVKCKADQQHFCGGGALLSRRLRCCAAALQCCSHHQFDVATLTDRAACWGTCCLLAAAWVGCSWGVQVGIIQ